MIHLGKSSSPEPSRFNPTAALIAVGAQLVLGGLLMAMAPSTPIVIHAEPPPTMRVVFVSPELLGSIVPAATSAPAPGAAEPTPAPVVELPASSDEEKKPGSKPRSVQLASAKLPEAPVEVARTPAPTPSPAVAAVPRAAPLAAPVSTPAPAPAVTVSAPPPAPPPEPAVERPPAAPAAPAGETRKARAIRTVLPVYPSMARSQGVGGVVTVEVTVGVDGSVEDAEVTQSPSPLLNAAAVDAAKKMKFEPALSNGAPIRARVTVPFNFALKK